MNIALYTLSSALHNEIERDVRREVFIAGIEAELGEAFLFRGTDFSDFGTHVTDVIYIQTGGTEGLFKALKLKGDIKLLTSGKSNSLAASMEILAWLRSRGQSGEILHGSAAQIAARIKAAANGEKAAANGEKAESGGNGASGQNDAMASTEASKFIKPLPRIDLKGIRLGVIGWPSDWLIASNVSYADVKHKLNAELVDIPMNELLTEINRIADKRRVSSPPFDLRSFAGSEAICEALVTLINRHNLGGLTLRCFDLLDTVHNTGCLALARLNAEGFPCSCEGDIPALLTMAWLQQTSGCPGFQCNLSRIDGDRLLFAHCTVPLNMTQRYGYMTHFESGIGTAIRGEMSLGEVRICKFSPDLRTMVEIPGRIIANTAEPSLCRTQIIVEARGAADYMLHAPLANHHIIAYR